jgi:hypothetical protein
MPPCNVFVRHASTRTGMADRYPNGHRGRALGNPGGSSRPWPSASVGSLAPKQTRTFLSPGNYRAQAISHKPTHYSRRPLLPAGCRLRSRRGSSRPLRQEQLSASSQPRRVPSQGAGTAGWLEARVAVSSTPAFGPRRRGNRRPRERGPCSTCSQPPGGCWPRLESQTVRKGERGWSRASLRER